MTATTERPVRRWCWVSWVGLLFDLISPKGVPKLTYFVESGTLNLSSVNQSVNQLSPM